MIKKINFFLMVIVLMAFFLRFNNVVNDPPALNWDEVSIAYNAYSISKTGKDEWNKPFPIHFKAYGEYKLPAQIYLSIPGIYLFGLNEFGVRITPVLYGTLTVLIMFFLGKALFENSFIGLTSAFLLAISPWHIQLTRASFESSLATFFIILGMWALVKGFKNSKWFIYSMIPFALSAFTYNSARIFTPLFLLAFFLIYRNHLLKFKRILIISVTLFTVLLLPLTPYLLSGERSSRYKLVSITDDPGLVLRINEGRGNSKLPQPLPRLVHNKVTYVVLAFSENYLAHFSPQFLFISGASHKQHHVQNIGELYLFQAPFLLIGLWGLYRFRLKGLLFSWLFLAFVPVSITGDSIPHALRTLIAAPFYQLVSAFGFILSLKWIKNSSKITEIVFFLSILVIVFISFSYYFNQYYNVYPKMYSRDWQYGYKQVVEYMKAHESEYDLIIFTRYYGEPHMFTLFFLGFDPSKYQNDKNLVRFESKDWVWVLNFDKYYFPNLDDEGTMFSDVVKQNSKKKLLFIGKDGNFPKEVPRLLKVNFLNGDDAFAIVEVKP